jgi:hypothetical protein
MAVATTWHVVGALGAAVGGIGAAIGAIAAWRSASASRATSQDALEALALSIAPALATDLSVRPQGDGNRGRWTAQIRNQSRFAATNIRFDATFRDGRSARGSIERLGPGEQWEVLLREVDMPPGGPSPEEGGRDMVLRYSDDRGIARYQQNYAFLVTDRHPGAPPRPTGTAIPTGEPARIA